MSASFTPGPLQMRTSSTPTNNGAFHLYLADEAGRKLAALWGGNDEKMANGYLWSAAPEMFEALLQYADDLRRPPEGDSRERRLERVQHVIARARGAA